MSAATNPHNPPYRRSIDDSDPAGGTQRPAIRIGHGYDLHRLEPIAPQGDGRPCVLGGVQIDHDRGPVGHSDGDALFHAITDALLGSVAAPDIGQIFPDTDSANEGANSLIFLAQARQLLADAGYQVVNLDATVVCESPKIGPHKAAMRQNIAKALGVGVDRVNVKGKTHERVDAIGEGRALEVHCVVLVELTNP